MQVITAQFFDISMDIVIQIAILFLRLEMQIIDILSD